MTFWAAAGFIHKERPLARTESNEVLMVKNGSDENTIRCYLATEHNWTKR
jgi:hypothetical protein